MSTISIADGVALTLNLLIQAQKISALIQAAQASGRSGLDVNDLKAIRAERDAALDNLDKAIANASGAQS